MSESIFDCSEHTITAQHVRGYHRSTARSGGDHLQLAVKQYVPKDNSSPQPGDVTIIACHAASMFKELYEPLFMELHRASKKSSHAFRIRGIWMADVVTHGRSGVLNEGRLGIDYSWGDHARDLLHMINVFRADMPQPLVGFGHSMGGTNIIQLSLLHPGLFTSIMCFEPTLNKERVGMNFVAVYGLTEQRDLWASRDEAVADSYKSPVMKTWDQAVLARWHDCGLRELPTQLYPDAPKAIADRAQAQDTVPVTLTTTKHHQARTYARGVYPPYGDDLSTYRPTRATHPDLSAAEFAKNPSPVPVYRPETNLVFEQLRFLRPSCFYIYGENTTFENAKSQGRADKLEVTGIAEGGSGGVEAGAVADVVLSGIGHFGPMEQPAKVAAVATEWLGNRLQEWKREDDTAAAEWDRVGSKEKAMIDDEWRQWIKKFYGRQARTSNTVSRDKARL
ncbi:hypothetical protein DOTSEDRAFT_54951 [Dothistroma septosporum NZE10]|uniref:AB hydrolase-1 domain-containing protein n=1 Tax=Dothistroma septosporum (strain NZE10 / CBS 128990) TaxID=675120 RepID=N1PJS4_DOTSN|nr:hypothetical protein DOTSEDRAFT_54951 [Dothistroma septosporum NZE10]